MLMIRDAEFFAMRRAQFAAWVRAHRDRLDALARALSAGTDPEPYLTAIGDTAMSRARARNLEADIERERARDLGQPWDREFDDILRRESDEHAALAFAARYYKCEPTREHAQALLARLVERRAALEHAIT